MSDMYEGMYRKKDGFGVGDLSGIKHADTVGWNNVTVGIASSIHNRILSQNGVKSFDPNVIPALEPLRAGRFMIQWLKIPSFFDEVPAQYLKFFLSDCVRGVDGVPDNQISSIDGTPMGVVQQGHSYPGIYQQQGKEVTLTTYTCSGDGLGKLMRYWLYAMSDPTTGVSTMYGKNLRFVRPNYSGTILFVFLGPTARPGDIEYSCIWHECWPTSPDGLSVFNPGQLGDVGSIGERSVTFSGIFQDGPEVDILAKYIVAGYGLYGQSYLDQILPGYVYTNFIDPIRSGDATKISELDISISQENKIASMEEFYGTSDDKTTAAGIRADVRDINNLEPGSANLPSSAYGISEAVSDANKSLV